MKNSSNKFMKNFIAQQFLKNKFYLFLIPFFSYFFSYFFFTSINSVLYNNVYPMFKQGNWSQMKYYFIVLLGNWFVAQISSAISGLLKIFLNNNIRKSCNDTIIKTIPLLSPEFIVNNGISDFLTYFNNLYLITKKIINSIFIVLIPGVFFLIHALILFIRGGNFYFIIIFFGWFLGVLISFLFYQKKQNKLGFISATKKAKTKKKMFNSLQHYLTYYLNNQKEYLLKDLQNTTKDNYQTQYKAGKLEWFLHRIEDIFLLIFAAAGVTYLGIKYVPKNIINIQAFISFMLLHNTLIQKGKKIIQKIISINADLGEFSSITKYLNEIPLNRIDREGKTLANINTIKLKKINFSFQDKEIVNNLSLDIKKGEILVVNGPSGCGKSTILNIISGLKQDYQGDLLFNDINLKSINMKSLKNNIVQISKGKGVYKGTILENLTMGHEFFSEEIEKVLKQVFLWDFVQLLPLKEHTFIGEEGSLLSGGQKQRLKIAKALLFKKDVLIFDEIFTGLDNPTIYALLELLSSLKDKTIIIASHKLKTLMIAHRVLFCYEEKGIKKWISGPINYLRQNCVPFNEQFY